ncbi:AarF/ABC1/UbiB kinase family protein [Alicyclobacillus sp. TC]|uniref:ABC1 kinase family protein n=1 Tax=Alicyclobacillus sp. TC TaxID=2606450 RepID=UPI0019336D92|nr:AarF/UbiB family protein [Alicyclobacillus sp. TC]
MWTRFSLYRIFVIVNMSIRFSLQIYWFSKRHPEPRDAAAMEAWEQLLVRQAREYRSIALSLQGLWIKIGQFLSTRADLLPDVFLHELDNLVDQVPPVPWQQVEKVMREAWHGDISSVLADVEHHSVASASIGVVYRGKLHDGTEVAVKVRRPGIDRIIRADFRAIRIVIFLMKRFRRFRKMADWSALYRELVLVIRDELNFRKEMENGQYFQDKYAERKDIHIPRYYPEFTTRSVLVMEWMEGAKVSDIDFLEAHGLNRKELAERLFNAYAEQIFFGGKFHADPHPGNLLVQSDGTIVFLDFGMVSSLRSEDAAHIRSLVEGILLNNMDQIIDALEALRFLLPNANRRELSRAISDLISLYQRQSIERFDETVLEEILVDIQAVIQRQPIQLPAEFAFLGRALSTFVGVLHILSPGIDIVALGKPIVESWIQGRGKDENQETGQGISWLRLAQTYLAPLTRYPGLVEEALKTPKERLTFERFQFHYSLVERALARQMLYSFLLLFVSFVALMLSLWFKQRVAEIIACAMMGLSLLWLFIVWRKQQGWLKNIAERHFPDR